MRRGEGGKREARRALCAAVAAAFAAAGPAAATPVLDCRDPLADCTLRQAADQAGVRMGAAVGPNQLANDPLYGPTLAAEFNSITAENVMKWPAVHPAADRYDFDRADTLVAFADTHDMRVRGHTLLWANPIRIPDWVNAIDDAGTLRATLDDHIRTVVGRYAGRIDAWDVINEPLDNFGIDLFDNVFLQQLGASYIADAFRIAHEADPTATLFLNEVLVSDASHGRFQIFYDLVKDLLDAGVPIHGVGLQGHYIRGITLPEAESLRAAIQAFADLGLVVELTELDISMPGQREDRLEQQGEIYEAIMGACLAVEACQGVTTWGFTDRYTWIDSQIAPGLAPLPFDEDYQRKPAWSGAREALLARVPEPGLAVLLALAALSGARRRRR